MTWIAKDRVQAAKDRVLRVMSDAGQSMTRAEILIHVGPGYRDAASKVMSQMSERGELVVVRTRINSKQTLVHYKLPPSAGGLLTVPFLAAPDVDALLVTGYHGHDMDKSVPNHTMDGFHAKPAMARVSPIASVFMV